MSGWSSEFTFQSFSQIPTNFIGIARVGNSLFIGNGSTISAAITSGISNIGQKGKKGFGVGICPNLPAGFSVLSGTYDQNNDNYGNYQYSDGSIMVWVPAFYYKYGTGAAGNGLAVNVVDIKDYSYFASVSAANTAGYALHRAFYNAGAIVPGFFVDKYLCSNNSGIASSIKNGLPLSSAAAHNPFSGLTGAPSNTYSGALAAAKTRGSKFFCNSRFIFNALAMLSLAHGQAASSTFDCAWYDPAGITNYPKGCNNNTLGDANDTSLVFIYDGYSNCNKTGSANFLAKTTHNGQDSGVVDLNGTVWEINTGFISDGSLYYLLNTSVDITTLTGGNALSTDAWGATSIAANYTSIGATYGALTASSTSKIIGNAAQVFDASLSGNAWAATCSGIPLLGGLGGTNLFGNDYLYDYRPADMCPVAGGYWSYGAPAGVWHLNLLNSRGGSADGVGFRSAYYL